MKSLFRALLIGIIANSLVVLGCGAQEKSNNPAKDYVKTRQQESIVKVKAGKEILALTLANNSSAEALVELLSKGSVIVKMQDYGDFEKVGQLPQSLPTRDEKISTSPGDVMLYQGNKLVIFYGHNSWSYTRLGKIEGAKKEELIKILGKGEVVVELSQ